MNLAQYIDNINQRYKLGNATEHTFRGDLQTLLESLVPTIRATNEPKRQSCGAPDYILTKKDIPIGFIEAKDIGDKDLEGTKKTGNKEQFDRYKVSLSNLIFTDYLNFLLYRDGQFVAKIAIAELLFPSFGGVAESRGGKVPSFGGVAESRGGQIVPLPENFTSFENLIKDFCSHVGQTIKSSKRLAEMMAGKARLLSEVIEKALTSDEEKQEDSTLKDQMNAFKQILIHDITPKGFADVYAQTITYGMFAARLHDPTLPTFSRQEAAELIPKSNPFLRKLFGYIAGPELDDRIKWIVDGLVEIFLACNVLELLKNHGKSTKTEDPIIHFYETFLSEYDAALRKSRGVWYTPHPVVNFQVRAVDEILKTEFGLPNGIADTGKIKVKVNLQGKLVEQEVHRVQILDPATGTGTYIAEVIKLIYSRFEGQHGIWSNYVENHLLPRLIGFELLMASYAMAHLQIDLLLTETGFKPTREQRLKIYLTNSLEESHPDTGTLFANWLSTEANEANFVKRDCPVMVVMGNPPYSGESANKGGWIMSLMEDYKKEPGGKEKLKERNPKWINDDYVKFIRYGQHFIEKNGSGILAFINPHGFLDNPTFRGMRWNLLKTYDKIYTIDLHGNSKKKETAPDGSIDQNVFDIMQGVSINIFVKTGIKKVNELGKVFHYDLFGKRDFKYDFLSENSLKTIPYKEILNKAPMYFMVHKDFNKGNIFDKGFKINELFLSNSVGIVTARDAFTIHNSKDDLKKTIEEFLNLDDETARIKYKLGKDVRDWQVSFARKDLKNSYFGKGVFSKISYRPFDDSWTFYTGKSKGFHCYPRNEIMQHFLNGDNLGLMTCRQLAIDNWAHIGITKFIADDSRVSNRTKERGYIFPLYLYSEPSRQQTIDKTAERTPNLNTEIVKQIAEKLGLTFVPEKNSPPSEGCPQGGVVNSPPLQDLKSGSTANPQNPILCTINNIPIKRNFIENLPCNHALSQRAKEKRKAGILSEVLFWLQVHKGAFHKIDFDRQRIIGNYIVDFYVKTLGLVVEIDGSSHYNKVEYDQKRQQYLENLGLRVYRISDGDVKMNLGIVMAELERYIVEQYGELTTPVFDHPSKGGELTTPAFSHPSREGEFAPIDILDYIYAVLHSPTYREKYKEFLKIDFPRVPFPKDKGTFWQLVKLGGAIRQIHLLESPTVEKYITQYPIDGNNVVSKTRFENSPPLEGCPTGGVVNSPPAYTLGKVFINETQYFDKVPQIAWDFYIGGYQPAQKWLKDRKERKLEFEDILHYQKIIVALTETDRLMNAIDKIEIE